MPVPLRDGIQIHQEIALRPQGQPQGFSPRQDDPAHIGGVARIRDQRSVAGIQEGQGEVGDALFGADQWQDLAHRVQLHAEAGKHPGLNRAAEWYMPTLEPVPGHMGIQRRRAEGFDHLRRRRELRIARTQVDDVHPSVLQCLLTRRNTRQEVRRKGRYGSWTAQAPSRTGAPRTNVLVTLVPQLTSTSTSSPSSSGPTPSGVPVNIRSPGSRVMRCDT